MQERVDGQERRPALTASVRGVTEALQVGTKKRLCGRTKKTDKKGHEAARSRTRWQVG
jgi:hypothetical protein